MLTSLKLAFVISVIVITVVNGSLVVFVPHAYNDLQPLLAFNAIILVVVTATLASLTTKPYHAD
jgi:hypothetical protein